ncbi:alpha/beta fold hydrolase [Oleomonas cavernae]|uniref:Alpha/beta fold hydrolase n=1 Tax=Oleomonas cavernae TaxID=2320859 RepID=A0A418WAY4_9PROT|nr:alpha/beta fold hydrolase [Oleomonas cavernae]RJF87182.1 alpha/beta fold hydrolase [Oleomonas cavernae]
MGESMESRHVDTGLGRLRLRLAGSGPALMFWPSLLMDGGMWQAQAAHFSDRYRVILVDSPGHGASQALTRLFSFEECARAIVEILDALGIDRAHFVGNSWGGMIGGTFAATYPARVGVAILMNCTASACGWRQKLEYFLLTRILWRAGRVPGFMVGQAVDAFIGPTSARERPQVGEAIRAAVGRANARSVYWAIRSVVPARPDQHGLMARIRTPVLVVAGEEDRTFPVAETAAMARSIPGAEFTVMKRTAHLAGLECPAEVNTLIDDFLARHHLG